MIAILLMLGDAARAAQPVPDLHLICMGQGLSDDSDSKTVTATTSDGKTVTGTISDDKKVPFHARLEFVFGGKSSRMRWPMSLIPPLNRAHDGWTILDEIKVTDDEITARTKMNFANHPRFRIDRVHGTIEMTAWGANFQGNCTIYKPEDPTPRAF